MTNETGITPRERALVDLMKSAVDELNSVLGQAISQGIEAEIEVVETHTVNAASIQNKIIVRLKKVIS